MNRSEPFWRRYLRFLGPDVDRDVEDELRLHLELLERDFREGGMGEHEAREAALARFGEYDEVREWLARHDEEKQVRRERAELLDGVVQDVQYGIRKLRNQPAFTVVAIATLALGIGATTAVFSAVDAILLRPLPFSEEERLVFADLDYPVDFSGAEERALPDVRDLASRDGPFTDWATYAPGNLNLTGLGDPLRVRVALVTPSFFATLGVYPATGRGFTSEDAAAGVPQTAVVSNALARRYFGEPSEARGRRIELNGRSYTVIGTMASGFNFPAESDLWLPLPLPMPMDRFEAFRQYFPSATIGRLAPGVSVEEASDRIRSLHAGFSSSGQRRAERESEFVRPLREQLTGDRRSAVLILFGATLLVLLVACANLANLLLSKAAGRQPEIAMRAALGASRLRIAQQLGIESLLLGFGGGLLGLALAFLSLDPLRGLVPSQLAGAITLELDLRVLAFTFVLVVTTSMVFGLWPIVTSGRFHAPHGLSNAVSRATSGRESQRVRRGLVVSEIAVALTLLVGAAVMLRSFGALLGVESGVDSSRVATLELSLAEASYGTPEERTAFVTAVLERLEVDPRVGAAAFVNELPMRGQRGIRLRVTSEGATGVPEAIPYAQDLQVSGEYFRALGIPLLRGSTFSTESESGGRSEVIVNEMLADQLWPGEDPIGKRLLAPGDTAEVIGLVGNVRPGALDEDFLPQMYRPLLRSPYRNLALVARGDLPGATLSSVMVQAVRSVDPEQPVYNVKPMDEVISGPIAPRRTNTALISIFGLLAGILAVIGVYGVLAYDVAQRARELGIRMAVGASPGRVLRHVLTDGLKLGVAGILLGMAGAWALVGVLESLVFGIPPRDTASFVGASILLLTVTMAAVLVPGVRAMRVDPARVIRSD